MCPKFTQLGFLVKCDVAIFAGCVARKRYVRSGALETPAGARRGRGGVAAPKQPTEAMASLQRPKSAGNTKRQRKPATPSPPRLRNTARRGLKTQIRDGQSQSDGHSPLGAWPATFEKLKTHARRAKPARLRAGRRGRRPKFERQRVLNCVRPANARDEIAKLWQCRNAP